MALNPDGVRVARRTVERLMTVLGLHGARRGRTMRTTRSDPAVPRPADLVERSLNTSRPDLVERSFNTSRPDLVERSFNASRPDALWVADFSSRADLGRVRLRGARHRRLQPAGFSHALPGPNWIGVLPLGAASMTAGQLLPQVRRQVDR